MHKGGIFRGEAHPGSGFSAWGDVNTQLWSASNSEYSPNLGIERDDMN